MAKEIDPKVRAQMEALVAKLQTDGKDYVKQKQQDMHRNERLEAKRYEALNQKIKSNQAKVSTTNEKVTHLFLDDERQPGEVDWAPIPEGVVWRIVKTVEDFIQYITEHGLPDYVSFDHDLGKGADGKPAKSGYDAAKWLVDYCLKNKKELPEWSAHSKSVVGRQAIEQYLFGWGRMKKIYNSAA